MVCGHDSGNASQPHVTSLKKSPKNTQATPSNKQLPPQKSHPSQESESIYPPDLPSFRLPDTLKPIKSQKIPHITQRVPVSALRVGNASLKITFNWMAPAKMALFQRGQRLFIAFDRPALFRVSSLSGQTGFISDVQPLELQTGSALILTLTEDLDLSFHEDPKTYNVTLTLRHKEDPSLSSPQTLQDAKLSAPTETAPSIPYDVQSGRIFLTGYSGPSPLFIEDPLTHEDLTVFMTETGLKEKRIFQEIEALPSLKGLVFLHKSDVLTVLKKKNIETQESFYLLSAGQAPLALSPEPDLTHKRTKAPLPQLINHQKWALLPTTLKELSALDAQLIKKLTQEPRKAQKIRLKRVFLLLSMGRPYEALGQLKVLTAKKPSLEKEPKIALLKGLSHVLAHQPDLALSYLSSPLLDQEEEALFWKGLADIQQNRAYRGLKTVLPHLKRLTLYPQRIRQTPYFLLAEAAVETKYPGKIFLSALETDLMSWRERNLFDLLSAQMETSSQNQDYAQKLYKKVLKGPNIEARIKAELALLDPRPEKRSHNIEKLESYRYSWRGDLTELTLLARLAGLYVQDEQPEKAMALYQNIQDHFASYPQADREISRGQDLFYKTFMKKAQTPHFKGIAFYERYKELTPEDDRRFTMLEQLSQLYASLDLLPQAAKVLETFIKEQNLQGNDLGKTLLTLAGLYEHDGQEQKLLRTIDRLEQVTLTDPTLTRQRLLARARFEDRNQRPQKALQLLSQEQSFEGLRLKARLAWKISDWAVTAQTLSSLIAHSDTSPEQREDFILSLSVALYKQGQSETLKSIRETFLPSFTNPKKKETFLLLTAPKPEIPTDPTYKELLAQITAIENFEASLQARTQVQ